MKKLSDSLADLQARINEAQQSAKATAEENQAKLEERSQRRDKSIEAGDKEFAASVDKADSFVRDWWYGTQDDVDHRSRKVHEAIARWRAEGTAASAERAAEVAEQHATAASELSRRMLDQSESAAVQAAMARAEARKLSESGDSAR